MCNATERRKTRFRCGNKDDHIAETSEQLLPPLKLDHKTMKREQVVAHAYSFFYQERNTDTTVALEAKPRWTSTLRLRLDFLSLLLLWSIS
ncbi:hypothetical protein MKW98_015606 [Papaver atlanticum]|uniref:Uncharacterized protein n=1 Tax=Papaver atlanticum TaxID=357466 RepID=A0AAD4S4K8_9MAGN|nr:hypothetical protein MKW98_015606 [Papaver atlanticum]